MNYESCLVSLKNYLLLFTIGLAPLISLPAKIDRFNSIRPFFFFTTISICLLIQIVIFLQKKSLHLPSLSTTLIVLLFLIACFVSTIFSIHPPTSAWGVWGLFTDSFIANFSFVVFFFLVYIYLDQKKSFFDIGKVLIFSSLSISLISIYQYYFLLWQRPKGTLDGSNFLAYFLGPILILIFYQLSQQKILIKKIAYSLVFIINSLAFLLTFSRSGWLFLLISFLVFFIYFYKKISKKFIICLIFFLAIIFINKPFYSRILSINQDIKNKFGSIPIRLEEQKLGWKLFLKNKQIYRYFIGTGPATTVYTFLSVRPNSYNYLPKTELPRTYILRNQYLQILNTGGILGLFLFSAFLITLIYGFLKSKKNFLRISIFTSWLFLAMSLFVSSQTIELGMLFWLMSALMIKYSWQKSLIFTFRENFKNLISIFILIFLSVTVCLFSLLSFISETYASSANFSKALKFTPLNDIYWRSYSVQLDELAKRNDSPEYMQSALKTARIAYEKNYWERDNLDVLSIILYHQSVLFENKSGLDEALRLTRNWIKLDPSNPLAYDAGGLIYLEMADPKSAILLFEKSTQVYKQFALGFAHSGEAYKQLGQTNKAIEAYSQAKKINPQWSTPQKELDKLYQDYY